jgi:pimeloyl-ACP methyl ester esterase
MPHLKASSGIDWHYDIEGEGSHLLFFHGWGVDKRIWRQQSKFFEQTQRVITFDLPGHGKSSWKKVPLETMANDVAELLKKLNVEQTCVVGSSLGGLLALKLYAVNPEVLTKLVLVGSMPKFAKSDDYPYGLDVKKMRKLGGQLNDSYPSIIDIFFRSLFTKEERESRRFKWLQRFRRTDKKPMQKALAEYLDILEQEDLIDVLKQAQLPIQFVTGEGDTICCQKTVLFLKEISPKARFDEFEKCGHFPFLSKPHEFNKVLKGFLEE